MQIKLVLALLAAVASVAAVPVGTTPGGRSSALTFYSQFAFISVTEARS